MRDKKKMKIYFIIASIYYLPYLFFSWGAVAGVKLDEVPFLYKVLQLIIPVLFIISTNINMKLVKKVDTFLSLFMLLLLITVAIFNLDNINTEIVKTILYYAIYTFMRPLNIQEIRLKFYLRLIFFTLTVVILEKYFLEKYFNIKPIFFMDWQERSIGNMGGPNTLGAFINLIYTIILFSAERLKNKIQIILTLVCSYMILCTDSQGALLVFCLINALKLYILDKKYFFTGVTFGIIGIILNINYLYSKVYIFIADGSNVERLRSLKQVIINIEIINLNRVWISNESPYLEILNNCGLVGFVIFILFLISIYLCNIKNLKDRVEKRLKVAIYIQMIVYSLFLPIIYIFPLNLIYILIIKTRGIDNNEFSFYYN
ncbi:MAG: hypothetical protein ACRCY7_04550 [Cetobacterium sp.]|uniref:hypothetical protein n=1 Tax=Cetobacterium sp. TaxID=2071632 RepID=UPI003F3A82E0